MRSMLESKASCTKHWKSRAAGKQSCTAAKVLHGMLECRLPYTNHLGNQTFSSQRLGNCRSNLRKQASKVLTELAEG